MSRTPYGLLSASPTLRALAKAAVICPTQQPRAISVRYAPQALPQPHGTKQASPNPPTARQFIDLDDLGTGHSKISLAQDLNLPPDVLVATAELLRTKAAAILGPLAMQALGPGAPQVVGPNAEGPPPIPIMGPQGAAAGPTGQVPASAAGQIAPPMGTPGAPVPPDPSQAQPAAPQAPPPPNPMAPAPMPGGAKTASVAPVGDLPGQIPGAPAGMGQPGPNVGAGAQGAASPLPLGTRPGGMAAGELGTGLPNQAPPTLPPVMNAALPPVGQAPLPGTGAVPGGAMRNSPATNPINMYGPISMQGEVNGNAGFGVKNSPVGDTKMASSRDVFQILGDLFEEYMGPQPVLQGTELMQKLSVVVNRGGKYQLLTRDHKRVLGTHPTAQAAYRQEYAIEQSQKRQKAAVAQPRKSAAGEGGIPYIIRPHTESGIDALKLDRYAYKGRRADSIVPPRYPAGDNGVRTTTSSA